MSVHRKRECPKCGATWEGLKDSSCPRCSSLAAMPGSVSAEQWWTDHANLLAKKMKLGGVKEFRIFLNYRGNYEFEVVPTATPNEKGQP